MILAAEGKAYVGQSVPRREDRHLLLGETTFLDDLTLPGMLWVSLRTESLRQCPYPQRRYLSRA